MNIKKLIKTIGVFIALKLLELWCLISIPIILTYICLAISNWSINTINTIFAVLDKISIVVGYLFFIPIMLFAISALLWGWIKSNWNWAKSIVK